MRGGTAGGSGAGTRRSPGDRSRSLVLGTALAAGLAGLGLVAVASCSGSPDLPVRQYPSEIVYLEQGWSNLHRQTYYYTPQGTELHGLRYDWFRYLELPGNRQRLADPAVLSRYGFLYDPEQLLPGYEPPPWNPGNLPVGFTVHRSEALGEAMLDITCAACHTGQIEYGGRAIRIDGGQALHAFASTARGQFVPTLVLALVATYGNPLKFDRFARNVLGLEYPHRKEHLRRELAASIDAFTIEGWQQASQKLFPVAEGYGRIDALDHIAATVFGSDLDPGNFRPGNAPVSYPHVWDIWKFDWVQWNGSVAQPMARNVGEALGVKARLEMVDSRGRALPPDRMWASSVLIPELNCIESTLWQLRAPIWDDRYLPPVDTGKVTLGRQVFGEVCAHCHGPHYYPERGDQATPYKPVEWRMVVVPTWEIGTDPQVVNNFLDYRYDAGALDPSDPSLRSIDGGSALALVTAKVIERRYREMGVDSVEAWRLNGWGRGIETRAERGYKSRPLHGIWATSPYLHNGSVPNLYEMLIPEEERSATFRVGSHRFDPVRVGYVHDDTVGTFLFDTSIPGNRNTGHQFRDDGGAGVIGRGLTDEERWAVVEFLKVFGSEPEDWGEPPAGLQLLPLHPPDCPATLQGPSAWPALATAVGPRHGLLAAPPSRVADTLVNQALSMGLEAPLTPATGGSAPGASPPLPAPSTSPAALRPGALP